MTAVEVPDAAQRLAILQTIADYAWRFDGRDASGWAQLFTQEGSWESRVGDAMGRLSAFASGRADIEAWALQRYRELGDGIRFSHHQSSTSFDRFGNGQAETRTLVIVTRSNPGTAPHISLTGTYFDTWSSVEGRWLFERRLLIRS